MSILKYQDFKSVCQNSGLKATSQRFIIYKSLLEEAKHPSADQLYASVTEELPGLSRDTVYRTLNMLADCGLAIKLVTPGGATHFDGDVSVHHHFLCENCARILDFAWPALDELAWPDTIWDLGKPKKISVLVIGTCKYCQ